MKNLFIIIISLIFFQNGNAQDSLLVKKSLFKINLLSPGFTYERGLGVNTTACLDANLSLGFSIRGDKKTVVAFPFLRGQYRYYYNLKKRISKGKDISNNSGNFLAVSASYYLPPIGHKEFVSIFDGATIGGVWGFQKTYKNKFNLSANAGLGYNFNSISNSNLNTVVPILNFTIGWVIGK